MDTILLSIKDSDITMGEIESFIAMQQARHPNHEVFMDGDEYAIVARPRVSEYRSNRSISYRSMLGGCQ